jgi:hypothetical protein
VQVEPVANLEQVFWFEICRTVSQMEQVAVQGECTSVGDVVRMKVIDGIKHLANCLCSVLFGEFALFADAVEQLSTCRQLGDDVVFVLAIVSWVSSLACGAESVCTLDSNQSWNLTMCGCFMRCNISSSS